MSAISLQPPGFIFFREMNLIISWGGVASYSKEARDIDRSLFFEI
jgi:hypothetical protein